MAATIALVRKTVPGAAFRTMNKVNGDTSYPNGTGYPITPQQLGYSSHITEVLSIEPTSLAASLYVPIIEKTLGADGVTITGITFKLENWATATEVANATNVSAAIFELITEGR